MKSCISLPGLAGDAWVHWCKSDEALLDSWQNGQFHTGMTATDFQAVEENQKSRTIQLTYDKNFPEKSILAYSKLYFFSEEVCYLYLTNTENLPRLPVQGSSGPGTRLLKLSHWAGISGTHQHQPLSFQSRTTKIYQNFTFNWLQMNCRNEFWHFLVNPMQLKMCDVQFLLTMARALVLSSALHSFSRLSQNQLAVGTATSKDRTFSTKLSILRTCYKRSVHPL